MNGGRVDPWVAGTGLPLTMFLAWAEEPMPMKESPKGVPIPGLATPEPGWHLFSGRHSRHPSCRFRVQYQPGLQVHMRFCVRVQA